MIYHLCFGEVQQEQSCCLNAERAGAEVPWALKMLANVYLTHHRRDGVSG